MPDIEKGIPIPTGHSNKQNVFKNMAVGDSIFFLYNNEGRNKQDKKLRYQIKKANNGKFTLRQWPQDNPTGLRVWKVT